MSPKTEDTPSIHFLIVPLMAQGHLIPMLDLARLLAGAGTLVTYVTTPVNAAGIRPIIDSTVSSGLPIRFPELRFPATDVGLPDGCENIDLVPSFDLYIPFMKAHSLFQNSLKAFLRDDAAAGSPPPSCIISHNLLAWTTPLASSLGVPRLAFHGNSCFFLVSTLLLQQHRTEIEGAVAEKESFAIPGLPRAIHVTKSQVNWRFLSDPEWLKLIEEAQAAERGSAGVVVNSFEELEPWYFETYRNLTGKKVWPIGPLSLHKEDVETKAARGKASAVDKEHVLEWLNGQATGSVLLVSFGSVSRNSFRQLVELGSGLEAAGRWPFIWVVKEAAPDSGWPEVEEWVAEFERRVGERGLVIKGWAPQAMILSHSAVGGFMTHCGWNSTLEAIAVGVPVATWPHFADQFLNEKLAVEVLKMGVEVGVEEPTAYAMEMGSGEVKVGREMVEKAVVRLMDDGEEGKERRARARQLGRLAAAAMAEGGSSSENLNNIICYISENDKKRET
ncbi:UDP-glycosyltransferase 73C1 [Apostasia shenzhenica]|uniref:Glycosyltransferase n=1 Tax=Apostasia shenzhenica TaxID=1088818 RepID=A0A2I0AMQ8_9ASPA|nr:UDP-glycosyltransferase 73C1 [Apostasia shenzhenica]